MPSGLLTIPLPWPVLAFVTARILGVVVVAPCFGAAAIPIRLRTVLGLMVAGVVAPLLAGRSPSWQPTTVAEEIPRCEMVQLGFNATYSNDKPVLGISLTPSTPTPPDEDTNWDFAELRLGKNEVPLRPRRDPRRDPIAYRLPPQGTAAAPRRWQRDPRIRRR